MALIQCPECGKEISDKTEVCVHCGYPLKNIESNKKPKSQKNKKLLGFIFTILGIVIAAIVTSIVVLNVLNSPKRQLEQAIEQDDFELVVKLYLENFESPEFKELVSQQTATKTAELLDACARGTEPIEPAIDKLLVLAEIYPTEIVIEELYNIKNSKKAFNAAEQYVKDERYLQALDAYSKVISSDVENYEATQAKLEDCKEKLYETALLLIDKGGYKQAADTFSYIESYKDSANYLTQFKTYERLYRLGVETMQDSFLDAYEYFHQLPDNYSDKTGDLKLYRQYAPYCGELIWTEGVVPAFDSDFYIEDGQLYWTYGWGTHGVFHDLIFSDTKTCQQSLSKEIWADTLSGTWFIRDFEIKDMEYIGKKDRYPDLHIKFSENNVTINYGGKILVFIPYNK